MTEAAKRDQHAALAKAMVTQFLDDRAGWDLWVAENGPFDTAYAIAQRLVRNLERDGYTIHRPTLGRGKVHDRRFDMRLKENRGVRDAV